MRGDPRGQADEHAGDQEARRRKTKGERLSDVRFPIGEQRHWYQYEQEGH